jgi:uncharacterized protein (DUF885 family)
MRRSVVLLLALLPALCLAVDTPAPATPLAQGWSREQSIRYFPDNSPSSESDALAETERFIAQPGQALAYMSGALEIERLRAGG